MGSPVRRELKWIELFRTLGVGAVVLGHTVQLSLPSAVMPKWVIVCFSSFFAIVPAFLIISGFLLRLSDSMSKREFKFTAFWKNKVNAILVPFLAWNIIYMFMLYFADHQPIFSWNTLFMVTTGYMQMYYLFVLLQFFLLFSLIHKWLSRRNLSYFTIAAAAGSLVFYTASWVTLKVAPEFTQYFEWHWGKLFLAWGLFFFWGLWLADHFDIFERLSRHLGWVAVASVLTYSLYVFQLLHELKAYEQVERQYFLVAGLLFQFVFANFLLALLYRAGKKGFKSGLSEYLINSGKDSYGIYLSHFLVLSIFLGAWSILGMPSVTWLKALLIAPLTWISAQLLVRWCRNPRLSIPNRVLFGARH